MATAAVNEQVRQRLSPIVPPGYRIVEPVFIEGGWKVRVENIGNPLATWEAWDPSLEAAIRKVENEILRSRPAN